MKSFEESKKNLDSAAKLMFQDLEQPLVINIDG